MKRILLSLVAVISFTLASIAEVPITKVDKIEPTDEIFMDMAVTAASKSVSSNGKPNGAVIIVNGAWRSTGIPTADKTAEEVAIEKSRLTDFRNASIYTVNEPTAKAYELLCKSGIGAIYFANPAADAVKAGAYPADAYNTEAISEEIKIVPMQQIPYDEAAKLLVK